MAWKKVSQAGAPIRLASWDVSRAHLYGKVKRQVCRLPEGDDKPGKVAPLFKSVYGLQESSHVWQSHWDRLLYRAGGAANPTCMYFAAADARGVVHGDDFLILGDHRAIEAMNQEIATEQRHVAMILRDLGINAGVKLMAAELNWSSCRHGGTDRRDGEEVQPSVMRI
eukprot:2429139-Amphidinium_carterae.1